MWLFHKPWNKDLIIKQPVYYSKYFKICKDPYKDYKNPYICKDPYKDYKLDSKDP